MDLVSLSNSLKNLSDEQLQHEQRSQQIPPVLVVAEMQRRDQMRKEYQAQVARQPGQKTVAEDLAERLRSQQMMPPAAGPQVPPRPPTPSGIAAIPGTSSPGMAGGGIARYAGGGEVDDSGGDSEQSAPVSINPSGLPTTVDEYNRLYPQMGIDEAIAKVKAAYGNDDKMAPIAAELAALSEKYKNAKADPWRSLATAGFTMAATPGKSAMHALGLAGLTGLQDYQGQKDTDRGLYLKTLDDRIGVAKQQANDADRIAQLAGHVYQAGNSRSNTMAETLGSNQRQLAKDAVHQTALSIMEQAPGMSYPQAYAQAKRQVEMESARVQAAAERNKAQIASKNATPEVQMFNGAVAQVAKKYGVQGADGSAPGFADLPLPAQEEVASVIKRRNPTLWSLAIDANNGDPVKAAAWVMQYHKANSANQGPAAPGKGTAFNPAAFNGVPVE